MSWREIRRSNDIQLVVSTEHGVVDTLDLLWPVEEPPQQFEDRSFRVYRLPVPPDGGETLVALLRAADTGGGEEMRLALRRLLESALNVAKESG